MVCKVLDACSASGCGPGPCLASGAGGHLLSKTQPPGTRDGVDAWQAWRPGLLIRKFVISSARPLDAGGAPHFLILEALRGEAARW